MGVIPNAVTGELATSRPFSDLSSLRERAERHAARQLALLEQAVGTTLSLPASAVTLAATDPLVRNLIAAFAKQVAADGGLADDERATAAELLAGLAGYGRTGTFADGLALPHRARIAAVGDAPHRIAFWEPPTAPGRLAARFASIVNPSETANLPAFTAEQRATFETALAILTKAIPAVAGSLLPHVDLVCRVVPPPGAETTIVSSSFRNISGVVFLSDAVLADPLLTAEHLLHEACHQRYSELARDASILCEGYDEAAGGKIVAPWHRPSADTALWGIDKALTAAHVYLHLAYFYGMLHDVGTPRAAAEPELIRRRLFSKLERTRFLLSALDATGRVQLGYAGNVFLDWMRALCASFAVADDTDARLTRLVFERCAEGDGEFFLATDAFSRAGFSTDAERYEAFMTWLGGLEPATSRRFEKCLVGDASLSLDGASQERPPERAEFEHAPLVRYRAARRERGRIIRQLLSLAPDELARRTDARAALTFARSESTNLDNFMSARFRDRLVRERMLRAAVAG